MDTAAPDVTTDAVSEPDADVVSPELVAALRSVEDTAIADRAALFTAVNEALTAELAALEDL